MKKESKKNGLVHQWVPDSLSSEVRKIVGRLSQTEDVQHIAIMPDVHLANDVCIGTVIATQSLIFPEAIGSDIGCGIAAIQLRAGVHLFQDPEKAKSLLKSFRESIPTSRHRRNDIRPTPAFPDNLEPSSIDLKKLFETDGILEFGTLGSGNHFLEVQADEQGHLWIMVHTGSRGMGHAIQQHHLEKAGKTHTGFHALEAHTPEGQAFLQDVRWALLYAQANRKAIILEVCRLFRELFGIEPEPESLRECHHNSVMRETHFGKDLWIHRKGANQAHKNLPGIIPGSMGTSSYLTLGRGCPEALCSSSHGAGRLFSRTEARQKISRANFLEGMAQVWFDQRFANQLIDEAPQAYKDIQAVMRAQRDLVKIEVRLRPILNFKGVK